MTAIAKKIEREIRDLPLEDMLALHEQLIASIGEKEDATPLDPAFKKEIQRRMGGNRFRRSGWHRSVQSA